MDAIVQKDLNRQPIISEKDILEMTAKMSLANSEEELMDELVHFLQNKFDSHSCDLFLKSGDDGIVLTASTSITDAVGRMLLPNGAGVVGFVFNTNKTLVVEDNFTKHPSYILFPGIDDTEFKSSVLIPLNIHGALLGALVLKRRIKWEVDAFTLEQMELSAQALTTIVAGSRKAFLNGSKPAAHLGALTEVTNIIANSPYLEEILQLLVNITAEQFGYKVCTVRLLDQKEQHLVLRATQSPNRAYQQKRAIKIGESMAGRAIQTNQPIIIKNVQDDPDYIGLDLAIEQGLKSMICVPLSIQGRGVGVLSCYTDEERKFHPNEVNTLETIAKQAAISIEHAKLQVRKTLMQEMHHRVRNNLQQVVSLLRLQLRNTNYKSIEEALNDTLSRIEAITAVHDLLSREDLDLVGVKSIAVSLVQIIKRSFVPPGKKIDFQVVGDNVYLGMTQATKITLIINELLQNAVEHGFRETGRGEIRVEIREISEEIEVSVCGNGDGLPKGFDIGQNGNLGLQIVESLIRAMRGTYWLYEQDEWVIAKICFPQESSE